MSLETVNFPVEFSGGIDTKTDPKRVIPGKLTLLENGVFTKGKKITKRYGYDLLSNNILGGGVIESSQGLTSFQNELIQVSDNTLYSWSTQGNAWVNKGPVFAINNSNETVIRNTFQQSNPDLARIGNLSVFVYEDTQSGGVNVTVIDSDTGTVIQNNVTMNLNASVPKVISGGNSAIIFYVESGSIFVRVINSTTPGILGTETVLANDVKLTNPLFDVIDSSSELLLSYLTNSNEIKLAYVTYGGVIGTTVVSYPNPITIARSGENSVSLISYQESSIHETITIVYANSADGLCYTTLNPDFTVNQAHSVIDSDIVTLPKRVAGYMIDQNSFGVFYEKATSSAATYDHYVALRSVTIGGAVSSQSIVCRSAGLASKPFTVGSDTFVITVHDSTLQATYFAVRSDGNIVSKIMPSQAGGLPSKSVLPKVIVNADDVAFFPAQIKTKFVSQDNTTFTLKGISLEKISFSQSIPITGSEISSNLLLSGGVVQTYDGATLSEAGFHFFPEDISSTPSTTGGSMASGVYQYHVIYSWVDRQGQKHRSAASVGIQATVTGPTGKVTLTIPTLRLTAKENVQIEVYRTQANGTQPYMVTSVTSPTYNSKTADTITFVDTLIDSSIISNEILYTSGGVLDNDAPGSASIIDVNKNRAIISGLEDPLLFGYSKQSLPGEGISFSSLFYTRVDPLGGRLATVKFMDDRIILFKDSFIFYVAGDGPDDTGGQNTFTPPTLITADVGCPYPQTCVLTPLGLMFKSSQGIYLLDRSLNVQYIGADVEAYNSHEIKSATLMDDVNQIRFVTNQGVALVYDYYFGQWSVFTKHGGVGATLWRGKQYAYVKSTGFVYIENKNRYNDGGVYYSLRIGTAWLKVNGLQGFQRVRRALVLGDFYSNHTLRVQVAYDYEDFFFASYNFDAESVLGSNMYGDGDYGDQLYGGSPESVYQFEVRLNRQKCQAIRFVFDDLNNPDAGAGYSLSDLTLSIGFKPGTMKLSRSKKVG
jgi:hypothetical protein